MLESLTLTTRRLVLRPFDKTDIETLHTLFGEEGVLRYFPSSKPPSKESVQQHVQGQQEHWRQRGYGLWAVERQKDGRLMGRSGLQYLPDTREVEVDFLLGKSYWGKGYATEAGEAALNFAFEKLGLDEIVGIVHPENKASRRVLEKLGLRLTSRTRYFGMDVCRYAVKREWFQTE